MPESFYNGSWQAGRPCPFPKKPKVADALRDQNRPMYRGVAMDDKACPTSLVLSKPSTQGSPQRFLSLAFLREWVMRDAIDHSTSLFQIKPVLFRRNLSSVICMYRMINAMANR